MSERDRGERPKKSWREIDATRDRAGAGGPPTSSGDGSHRQREAGDRASKQYRAALDALFAKGEVGKLADQIQRGTSAPDAALKALERPIERAAATPTAPPRSKQPSVEDETRAALRKKILEAIGRDEISRAVDRYLKQHPMPSDFEVLEQALEHNKTERVALALETLETLLTKDRPKRSRTLVGKLRMIEETGIDAELAQTAARLRAKLA